MPRTISPSTVSAVMAGFGRKGGSVTSAAKTAAARANGRKGGRPKKPAVTFIGKIAPAAPSARHCERCGKKSPAAISFYRFTTPGWFCFRCAKQLQKTPAVPTVKYEGTIPKTLRTWIDKHAADKVFEVSHGGGFCTDSGSAYDIGIRPGYAVGSGTDVRHTVIEETVSDTIALLKTLHRCEADDECRAAWGMK